MGYQSPLITLRQLVNQQSNNNDTLMPDKLSITADECIAAIRAHYVDKIASDIWMKREL